MLNLADNIIKNVRAIILKKNKSDSLFLSAQEPSGVFIIPGGCGDADDADLLAALHSELQEELYLDPHRLFCVGDGYQKGIYKPLQSSSRVGREEHNHLHIHRLNLMNELFRTGLEAMRIL